nr:MAG TPA: hypothetical protein [Caudoviricetes sp.]
MNLFYTFYQKYLFQFKIINLFISTIITVKKTFLKNLKKKLDVLRRGV